MKRQSIFILEAFKLNWPFFKSFEKRYEIHILTYTIFLHLSIRFNFPSNFFNSSYKFYPCFEGLEEQYRAWNPSSTRHSSWSAPFFGSSNLADVPSFFLFSSPFQKVFLTVYLFLRIRIFSRSFSEFSQILDLIVVSRPDANFSEDVI